MSYGIPRAVDPFHEDPLPRAHYHPSPPRHRGHLTKSRLSPERLQQPGSAAVDEDEFLRENLHYRPAYKLLTEEQAERLRGRMIDDEPSQFDESWPASEVPSALSLLEADSMIEEDILLKKRILDGRKSSLQTKSAKTKLDFRSKSKPAPASATGNMKTKTLPEEEDSTLSKYIQRFRSGLPVSREERSQEFHSKDKDFWWLKQKCGQPETESNRKTKVSGANTDDSRSRSEAGLIQKPWRSPYRRELTARNLEALELQRSDQPWSSVDRETDFLQQKADNLLEKTGSSLTSDSPIVSTVGLGSSLSDVSHVSEEPYRPAFTQKQTALPTSMILRGSGPHNDILQQWRLRRKMEGAKERLVGSAPKDGGFRGRVGLGVDRQSREYGVVDKLSTFRRNLAGIDRGLVSTTQQRAALNEPAFKVAQNASSHHSNPIVIASPSLATDPKEGVGVPAHYHLSQDILVPNKSGSLDTTPGQPGNDLDIQPPSVSQHLSSGSHGNQAQPQEENGAAVVSCHCRHGNQIGNHGNQDDSSSNSPGLLDTGMDIENSSGEGTKRVDVERTLESVEEDQIPERDVPEAQMSGQTKPKKSSTKHTSVHRRDVPSGSDSPASLTEVSDLEDLNFQQKGPASSNKQPVQSKQHHRTGRLQVDDKRERSKHEKKPPAPSKSSRQDIEHFSAEHDSLCSTSSGQGKSSRTNREQMNTENISETKRAGEFHGENQKKDRKGKLPLPRGQSSPKRRPLSTAIGQAVKDHLLSGSLSLSESEVYTSLDLSQDPGQLRDHNCNHSNSKDGNHDHYHDNQVSANDKGDRVSCHSNSDSCDDRGTARKPAVAREQPERGATRGSPTESATVTRSHGDQTNRGPHTSYPRTLIIGDEAVQLSDGDEFPDDDLLSNLRSQRSQFLRQLQEIDSLINQSIDSST